MKLNIKSRKGFTLIELLVVIGILAVLAAIAIPSVAGLIDRANVSSDVTNSNEMTNAVERFTSEYELYVQDIGSGALNPNDLDSAQGRVYNVTGATTRGDITAIEKPQTVKVADLGDEVAIYRDTKYPVNEATLKKVIENYTKTNSSTFEPKQSDCHYYYSPDCGIVVCTETDKSSTDDLNKLVISGKDAKGKELGPQTQWIDLTSTDTNADDGVDDDTDDNNTNTTIEPGLYQTGSDFTVLKTSWDDLINNNVIYVSGGVVYTKLGTDGWTNLSSNALDGELVLPSGITALGSFKAANSGNGTGEFSFTQLKKLTSLKIPEGVTTISDQSFMGCNALKKIIIPSSVNKIGRLMFSYCSNLQTIEFGGTKAEWDAATSASKTADSVAWSYGCNSSAKVICTDGTYSLN